MRYDWTVEIAGDDVSQWVKAGGTIDYGRPARTTSFQAPTAIFTLFTKDENPNPAPAVWPAVDLGDPVIIHVTVDGVNQYRRFTGIVQALDWGLYELTVTATGYDVDVEGAPGYYGGGTDWQLVTAGATGPIAPRTVELETERVTWLVETTSPFHVEIEGVPARKIRTIPTNQIGQPLLDQVLRIADDCDALLLQDRLGVMRYRTKNFTRPARWTIPAHLVESTSIDLAYERGTVVDTVVVYYGEPDPATGNQKYRTVTTNQQTTFERRQEIYTDIAYLAGADGRGEDFLAVRAQAWEMPDVTLVMNQATEAEAETVLELQENWRVRVTPLPTGCPIPQYDGDILGFTEVMHETDYRVILHLAPAVNLTPEDGEGIFPEDSIVGGTTSQYTDQYGWLWQLHTWTTPGDYTATVNHDVTVHGLACAGGGQGAYVQGPYKLGGGGAGEVWEGRLDFTPGTLALTVGAGGKGPVDQRPGPSGHDTRLAGITCKGGGGGEIAPNEGPYTGGLDGGSGGALGGKRTPGSGAPAGEFHGSDANDIYGGGASGTGLGGWLSSITGTEQEYGRGGISGTPDLIVARDGYGDGGRGGNYAGAGVGGDGGIYLRYRIA